MSESLKAAVRSAVLRLLDPLVKWLLEAGVGVGDLLPLIKIAYVRAAREQGLRSSGELKRPNASRISVVTGLTRAEVANILAAEAAEPTHHRGRQRAERVLSGWWNDATFQDSHGHPAALAVRGSKRSFAALVERYSGERWRVATVLDELLRVKAVRRLPDGRLQAVSRTYATVRWDPDGVTAFGEHLAEFCATLLHNLNSPAHRRYVRRVVNVRLDPRYVPMLVRDLEEQAESFADSTDDSLNAPRHTITGRSALQPASLGVTLFVFEPPLERETESVAAEGAHKRASHRSGAKSRVPRRIRQAVQ